jgi:hypothetical protein
LTQTLDCSQSPQILLSRLILKHALHQQSGPAKAWQAVEIVDEYT